MYLAFVAFANRLQDLLDLPLVGLALVALPPLPRLLLPQLLRTHHFPVLRVAAFLHLLNCVDFCVVLTLPALGLEAFLEGVEDVLAGDEVVVDDVLGDLVADAFAEVGEGLGEDEGGRTGKGSKLLVFLTFRPLLLHLLDPQLDQPQRVVHPQPVHPVLAYVLRRQLLTGPHQVVLEQVDAREDESEGEEEDHEGGGGEDDDVAGEVELGELDQQVAEDYVGAQVLQDEDELPAFPLSGLLVMVETLGAPGEVVDAAEGEDLEQVDVGGREVDVGEERGEHFHRLAEATGPQDGHREAHDHEEDERPQVDEGDEELLRVVDGVVAGLLDDGVGVVDEQPEDEQPVDADEGGGAVVDDLELAVVVVDHGAPEDHGEDGEQVGEVEDVGDGEQDLLDVEDVEHVVVGQLEVLLHLEELLDGRHHVIRHEGDQRQVHRQVEQRRTHPLQLLHQVVVHQLQEEHGRRALVAVLAHVVVGEPGTVDPPPTLAQQFGEGGDRVDGGLDVGQVVQVVLEGVDAKAEDTVLSQVHVGVFQREGDVVGEAGLEVAFQQRFGLLLLVGRVADGIAFAFKFELALLVVGVRAVADAFEGLPAVAGEGAGQDVDVVEAGLEGLVQHVRVVVLELLGALDGDQVVEAARQAVHVPLLVTVKAVAQVVGGVLDLETHVAADAAALGVEFHVPEHAEDGVGLRFHAHVGEHAVVGVEEAAEALEEKHVRVQLPRVAVFHAQEEVVVLVSLRFVQQTAELVLGVLGLPWVPQVVLLHADRVDQYFVLPRVQVPAAQLFDLTQRFVNQFVPEVPPSTQVLLDFFLRLKPVAVLSTVVHTELLILVDDITGQQFQFQVLLLHQRLDLPQQFLGPHVLLVLVLEETGLEVVKFFLREEIDLGETVVGQVVGVKLILFYFTQEVVEGHGVGALAEAVLDVDLVEERDHVFSLVLGGVEVFDAIEDDHDDDFVGHDAGLGKEVLVAFLDALDGRLQHVLRLRVDADADGQLDPSFLRVPEEREQSVAGRVRSCPTLPFGVYREAVDFLFVQQDWQYFLLIALIRVVGVSLHDLQPLLAVQPHLARLQEDLGEEILELEDAIVVGFLQLVALQHFSIT